VYGDVRCLRVRVIFFFNNWCNKKALAIWLVFVVLYYHCIQYFFKGKNFHEEKHIMQAVVLLQNCNRNSQGWLMCMQIAR
jgi:phosphatidylglycerophosphate synthase